MHINNTTNTTLIILVFALIGYVASFIVQPPPNTTVDVSSSFHWDLANSVLYTSLYTGAAILFLMGANAYKAKLRLAYMAIAIGIALIGISLAQVVLIRIFGLLESPWVEYGGVMAPFVLAGFAIYFGIRLRTKLVNITSSLTKVIIIIIPSLLVSAVLVSLLPHGTSTLPEAFFDLTNVIIVFGLVFYVLSLGLALKIKNRGGAHYASSMKWLMWGFIVSIIVNLLLLVTSLITGEVLTGYILDAAVITSGLIYMKAGHSFARTKELR